MKFKNKVLKVLVSLLLLISMLANSVSTALTIFPIFLAGNNPEMNVTADTSDWNFINSNNKSSINVSKFGVPEDKKADYNNLLCINHGLHISYDTVEDNADLYGENIDFFKDANKARWLLDNFYLAEQINDDATKNIMKINLKNILEETEVYKQHNLDTVIDNLCIDSNDEYYYAIYSIEQALLWKYTKNNEDEANGGKPTPVLDDATDLYYNNKKLDEDSRFENYKYIYQALSELSETKGEYISPNINNNKENELKNIKIENGSIDLAENKVTFDIRVPDNYNFSDLVASKTFTVTVDGQSVDNIAHVDENNKKLTIQVISPDLAGKTVNVKMDVKGIVTGGRYLKNKSNEKDQNLISVNKKIVTASTDATVTSELSGKYHMDIVKKSISDDSELSDKSKALGGTTFKVTKTEYGKNAEEKDVTTENGKASTSIFGDIDINKDSIGPDKPDEYKIEEKTVTDGYKKIDLSNISMKVYKNKTNTNNTDTKEYNNAAWGLMVSYENWPAYQYHINGAGVSYTDSFVKDYVTEDRQNYIVMSNGGFKYVGPGVQLESCKDLFAEEGIDVSSLSEGSLINCSIVDRVSKKSFESTVDKVTKDAQSRGFSLSDTQIQAIADIYYVNGSGSADVNSFWSAYDTYGNTDDLAKNYAGFKYVSENSTWKDLAKLEHSEARNASRWLLFKYGKYVSNVESYNSDDFGDVTIADSNSENEVKYSIDYIVIYKDGNEIGRVSSQSQNAKLDLNGDGAYDLGLELSGDGTSFCVTVRNPLKEGNYSVKLIKTDSKGTALSEKETKFKINGKETLTQKGEIEIVNNKNITQNGQTDEYEIEESAAPEGYDLYTGKIKLTAVGKETSSGYDLDDSKTKLTVNGEQLEKDKESKDGYVTWTKSGNTIIIKVKNEYADLSLRKFITKVDDKEINDREPEVDITPLIDGTETTAKYTHTKEPVLVAQNQIVTYTIRIYNEGAMDTYASLVKDDIPQGLEFVSYTEGDGSINDTYKWKLVDENDNEVTDATKAKYVITNYLSKANEANEGDNLLKAFDKNTMDSLDYRDIKIQFKVVEPNTSDRIIINEAQISEETDKNGNPAKDRDSTPNKWVDGEDDQDIEKVKVLYFDLALRKWVTQAIVTEDGKTVVTETGHKAEDNPEEVVKVDLKKSKINNVTVKFKYSIRITNEGEIAGEATEIRDDIPNGLKFVAEDNPDWREENGQIVTNKLEHTTLQPGESAEVEIVLTWINGTDNMGVMINTAEINKDHNEYGTPDIDSTPGNNVPGEDDIDDAPVMLTVKTGNEIALYIAILLGATMIVAVGIVMIKKKVLAYWK